MKAPACPTNEKQRLQKLHNLDVLDTPPESMFDDYTRLASIICGTEFSVVSLIDDQRQWFKSIQGNLGVEETSRDVSFCGHAILGDEPFIIEDSWQDERFFDNPVVLDGPKIRFYAGVPLVTHDGHKLGTLCVFDPKPATISPEQKEALVLLARQVTSKLEQRLNDILLENIGAVLDISDAFVILVDPKIERVTFVNTALKNRLGNNPTWNAPRLLESLFPDMDFHTILRDPSQLQSAAVQTRLQFPDAPDGMAELRILPRLSMGRRTTVILFRDNTELFRTQSTAREAQTNLRLFNQVANQTKNGVVICNSEGRIEWVNRSFELTTGYTLSECIGRKPGSFLQGPETSEAHRKRMADHINKGIPVSQDILNYSKEGQPYWVEVVIEPIRDENGKLTNFVSTQTDITDRKQQESALKAAKLSAELANQAKSQFLANISHELRTPLNGIIGMTESLRDRAPKDLQSTIGTLNDSSMHLFNLLNDILDLSQLESGHMTMTDAPFNTRTLLNEVEALFRERAKAVDSILESRFDPNIPECLLSDKTRLKQVLVNLTSNAIKFTHHGTVTISATSLGQVQDKDGQFCEFIRYSVQDTGPGISEQDQERIFENFEQLDNSSTRVHGGSGLGLAISRSIVKALGGHLQLISRPGEGAEFSFELALKAANTEAATDERRPLVGKLKELHALIVDDNEVNRTVLSDLLDRAGLGSIYTAASARRALVLLDNIQPDLIFLDIQMPEIDGFELLERIRREFGARGRTVPIMIACTADVSNEQRQKCLQAGFDYHLGKPITSQKLDNFMTGLTAGKQVVDEDNLLPREQATLGPLLNMQHISEAFDTDIDLINDFLVAIQDNIPAQMRHIEQSLESGEDALNSAAAHQLKGLVSYFGHQNMLFQAEALQHSMEQNDRKVSARLYQGLKSKLSQLLNEIALELERHD